MAKQTICAVCATIQTTQGIKKCSACKSKDLIPLDSPKGKELAAGQTVPPMKYWTGTRVALGVLMGLFAISWYNGQSQKHESSSTVSPSAATASSKPASIPPADDKQYWYYDSKTDGMTSDITYSATLFSDNKVNFSFPYDGAQRGTLTLRTHPRHGKDVMLGVNKGQFLCTSYDGCSVLVRFDDAKPVRFSAVGPDSHDTTIIFIRDYGNFVGKMMKSKKVRIEAPFYQQGGTVFEFSVHEFDSGKYLQKDQAVK